MAGKPKAEGFARVLTTICNWALYIAGTGLVLMTCIVMWQVFVRFVLNWTNTWTEITAVMLMSWFIFLGAAVGVRENYHLGFDVLLYALPPGGKKYLRTISDLVVLAFAIGMIVYGIQLVKLQWPARMPALGIPEGIRYLPLAGGGVLITLFALERLVLRLKGYDVDSEVADEVTEALQAAKEA
ncbi:TRAP transporter small permease [Neorhizobium sp. T786]|uniref:TRAP transporter small permease n=1 Tax=Pseudorhizobium xiangyangii TaxID=2883104 RepID=UPI001CFFA43B|nr:TRAP transporter small permease [Neorhizobium xiangyangii]MCB5203589.1 TRAP transporter small permease [Neorhizobium xiangyangii]